GMSTRSRREVGAKSAEVGWIARQSSRRARTNWLPLVRGASRVLRWAMSIKRSREVRHRRDTGGGEDASLTARRPPKKRDWEKEVASHPDDAFTPYVTSARYVAEALLVHPTFGKGVVVAADPQRIEVLFQDGPKKLVHGRPAGT